MKDIPGLDSEIQRAISLPIDTPLEELVKSILTCPDEGMFDFIVHRLDNENSAKLILSRDVVKWVRSFPRYKEKDKDEKQKT